MKILVINPIGTDIYNKSDYDYFKQKAANNTTIKVVSLKKGPNAITNFESEIENCPEILDILKTETYDAAIINCFGNPCIDAAKEVSDKIVVGPGEAALYLSLLLGDSIAIITPTEKIVPLVMMNVRKMGIEKRVNVIKSVNIDVEALNNDQKITSAAILKEAIDCVKNYKSDVVVLGCTGMAYVADQIKAKIPVPLIEPAAAALKVAELLYSLNLKQSKYLIYKA